MAPILGGKYASAGWILRPGYPSPYCAGSDPDLGIVPDTFVLARITACHHIELAMVLGKPNRGVDHDPIPAESRKVDVFLTLNLGWDGRSHPRILIPTAACKPNNQNRHQIAPDTLPVLQALHA